MPGTAEGISRCHGIAAAHIGRPGWQGRVNHNRRMLLRAWTLVVWALVAASAAFWGLRLFVAAPALPPQTQVAAPGPGAHADLGRLLGADAPPPEAAAPPADARYQLLGVVSPRTTRAAGQGLALIVVDGKPARAFRVGTPVDAGNVLQSVNPRGASLGPRDGATAVALTLAPPTPAATGTLPTAGAAANAPQPMRPARSFTALPRRVPPTAAPSADGPATASEPEQNGAATQ